MRNRCVNNNISTRSLEIIYIYNSHDGPVWQIVWGHPKFGSILASCGFDRKVRIWKEIKQGTWDKVYEFNHFEASGTYIYTKLTVYS